MDNHLRMPFLYLRPWRNEGAFILPESFVYLSFGEPRHGLRHCSRVNDIEVIVDLIWSLKHNNSIENNDRNRTG